ncbi:MAG TPA: NADH:ubiquinone reductase (Na(+)-transporting) subunit C, partial [Candidatus Hydrogenedentes bacterium]|nr:NADH:ubiquinone reductase (Na(+)-transporting) subunit C [Candidatus Hydrogenedentota bacterium]
QEANRLLFKRKNVLVAAGLAQPGERMGAAELAARFGAIQPCIVEMTTGNVVRNVQLEAFYGEETAMFPAPQNTAGIAEIPERMVVFLVLEGGGPDRLILPIEGKGLWSTLYGFLALDAATLEVRGITFYEHGETPGLGGEIENPTWQALWNGRRAFDEAGNVILRVVKGKANAPNEVDGLSGATMTSRGVSNLVRFWLGDGGFGPYLRRFRAGERT